MSTFAPMPLTCPACGHEQVREVARSVDVSRTPEARQAVLDQTFQVFTCERCGRPFLHTGELTWLDLARHQLFGVFPAAAEPDWPVHEQRTLDAHRATLGTAAPPVAQALGEGLVVRCVFGLPALREKLVLFDAGLDDVLVEAAKLDLLRRSPELTISLADRPRLEAVDGGDAVFRLSQGRRLTVARPDLDRYLADAAERRDDLAADLAAGPYVDLGRLLVPHASSS